MPDKFVPLGFVAISTPPLVVLHNLYHSVFFRGFRGFRGYFISEKSNKLPPVAQSAGGERGSMKVKAPRISPAW